MMRFFRRRNRAAERKRPDRPPARRANVRVNKRRGEGLRGAGRGLSGLMRAALRGLGALTERALAAFGRSLPYVLIAIVMALLPLTAVYGYRYLTVAPSFAVSQVRVDGHAQISAEEVLATAGVDHSPNLLALSTQSLEKRLVAHPWILSARVERELPDRLQIRITERKPVALIALGPLYLVDERGAVFKRVASGEHWDFPVITGLEAEDLAPDASSDRRKTARRLVRGALKVRQIWTASPLGPRIQVSEIAVDPLFGYSLVLGRGVEAGVGAMVRLGSGELRGKLTKLEAVLKHAQRTGRTVAEIRLNDERDPSRVAVRFRDGTRAGGSPGEAPAPGNSNDTGSARDGIGETATRAHLARTGR